MACTGFNLTPSWVLIANSGAAKSLQVQNGQALVVFATNMPSDNSPGFILDEREGITADYGTGNIYAKSIGNYPTYLVTMS